MLMPITHKKGKTRMNSIEEFIKDTINKAVEDAKASIISHIIKRFDVLEKKVLHLECCPKPDRNLTDEQIVSAIDNELSRPARNDTLATDRITRLANRIEFYGLTDAEFAAKNRYWKARVAYLRHGDFPNPGIDRNSPAFTKMLKECVEMIRPTAIPDVKKK